MRAANALRAETWWPCASIHIGEMVGRHGFAPCSRRLRAGTSLSKFATRKERDAKVELNHRNQACEVLADTRIRVARKWTDVLAHGQAGNAPACSCSRSRRGGRPQGPFRLRSETPKRTESGVRPLLRPCGASADEPDSLGKWTGMRVARPLLRFGRPACVSQHLCPW